MPEYKPSRADNVAEFQRLARQGLSTSQIAERTGFSKSTVREYLNDPTGEKIAARKRRNMRQCLDCGRSISPTSKRCPDCANLFRQGAVKWTRELIIDAIQRFNAKHGRPPTSPEWILINREEHYPGRSQVYGRSHGRQNPFPRWADAIEAAGFPRPEVGRYQSGIRLKRPPAETIRRRQGSYRLEDLFESEHLEQTERSFSKGADR